MSNNEPKKDDKESVADFSAMLGMGGFLDGVSNLIGKFGELAEKGETLRKSMGDAETSAKPIRTSGGFTVRFGGLKPDDGESESVKPMNAASRTASAPKSSTSTPVPKERVANVELFEEADHLLLLAEMPGVASDDVSLDFEDKKLSIAGSSKTALFKAQVHLPRIYTAEQVAISANNGVVEIRLNNG